MLFLLSPHSCHAAPVIPAVRLYVHVAVREGGHFSSLLCRLGRAADHKTGGPRYSLPPTVHSDSRYRDWQRRFYPFGVYGENKRLEKLNYMHNNPVKRGLVHSPEEWLWSSFRFYYLNDSCQRCQTRWRAWRGTRRLHLGPGCYVAGTAK